MRLSTSQMFNASISGYQKGYADLVKTQQQLTSGHRIQTPADDPVGSARLLQLEQQAGLLGQYQSNLTDATNSLTQEESILQSIIGIAQRARTLAGHAGNGAYGDHDRKAIAAELAQIEAELFGLMNSKNASGEYWFSGSQSGVQPYVRNGDGSYIYQGDQGQQSLQVATGVRVTINDSGFEVFESARNVTRTVSSATAPATADGKQRMYLSSGTVSDQVQFNSDFRGGGPYRLEMTSSTTYVIYDKDGNDVTADSIQGGVYSLDMENPKINFRGVEFILDATLEPGTVDPDAALTGHEFTFDLAPERFVATSSSAAQISNVVVADQNIFTQAFPSGGMKLVFTSATDFDAYTSDGAFIDSGTIGTPFAGVNLTFTGAPAVGDEFKIHVDSQENQNILNTIATLRKALEAPADGLPDGGPRIREAVAAALGNLDSSMIQIEKTQAHIGARVNIIETLTRENESLKLFNASTQSAIRDTDQFEAASRLMLQQTKLEAAQAAFVRVSQLSLFDRL
jgi:flagellar hook-associated protein 3 FlgL